MTTALEAAPARYTPEALFAAIDRMDVSGMVAQLSPDVVFQFGNNEPVAGRAAVAAAVETVFTAMRAISHAFVGQWRFGDVTVLQLVTTYTLPDGRSPSLPAAVILRHGADGLVADYRIYQDVTPLWAAS